jgi:Protein of unknown function (DUF4058)
MPSPFPGMDPYLEAQGLWESFHASLVGHCADALNERLPKGYVARLATRITLLSEELSVNMRLPDTLVARKVGRTSSRSRPQAEAGGVATIEPVTIPLSRRKFEVLHRWVEVLTIPDHELVTVIEILSPTNKIGVGRGEYLKKRDRIVSQAINLVEIDLLLRGRRMPMGRKLPPGEYFAIVARTSERPNAQVYAWTIRDALPPVPIPLREPDPDVLLNLAGAFNRTYDWGRFSTSMRYGAPLPKKLPLERSCREWAEGVDR